jgi:hypothetical protein
MVAMLEARLFGQRVVSERLESTLVFAGKNHFGRTGPRVFTGYADDMLRDRGCEL